MQRNKLYTHGSRCSTKLQRRSTHKKFMLTPYKEAVNSLPYCCAAKLLEPIKFIQYKITIKSIQMNPDNLNHQGTQKK